MTLDLLVFFIVTIIIYWVLNNSIALFVYSGLLIGVFLFRSDFVLVPSHLNTIFDFVVASISLASMGKFYWIIRTKKENQSVFNED